MTRKPFRLIAVLTALCLTAALLSPAGLAADDDSGFFDLRGAVEAADPGATVTLPNDAAVAAGEGEAPWIISKDVTIDGQGRVIYLRTGGVLLGGNVTIQNARLNFTTSTRNAIIANGYDLTLDGVTAGGYPFNVFAGTLLPNSYENIQVPSSPETANTVTIQGSTNLQGSSEHVVGSGNIYAGSLSMGGMSPETGGTDGQENTFAGNPVIRINGCANPGGGVLPLGQIYAGGAQQKNPPGVDGQKRTIPDPDKYTVGGTVTIVGSKIPHVDGAGAATTLVEYDGQYQDTKVFSDISSLSVRSGDLVLDQGSSFRQDASLSLSSGAKLTVSSLYNGQGNTHFTVDRFSGNGGVLVMDAEQTMTAAQEAEGSATVAIGGTNNSNTNSTSQPTVGHTYIRTPVSSGADFQLLPHSLKPGVRLERDTNGSWTAVEDTSGEDPDLVKTLRFDDPAAATVQAGEEAVLSMTAENAYENSAYLDFLPLTININDKPASRTPREIDGDIYYTYSDTFGYFSMEITANNLCVSTTESCPAGRYTIRVIVPKENAVGENALFTDAVLTVTGGGDPGPADPTLSSISVNSTGHKTEYKVGDALDVSGLTIEALYSDGSKKTVDVTEAMVSGFDSSQAAESRTLTVTYQGKTTTYAIRVAAAPQPPVGTKHRLTVGTTGSGGTAEGTYEYPEGADVTVRAGSKAGKTFAAWDAVGLTTLDNRNSPDVSFKMPGGDVTLNAIWSPAGVTPPSSSHTHAWSSGWKTSAGHHWHDCAASGCPVTEVSEKDGYAAHTAGDWVVDRPASSTQSGIRHKSCTVCGYEMVRETLPATGGGSSSGGSSSGGSSSSGSSSSGSSSSNTTTVKHPDGSSVSTTVNAGTVTETTRRPDGSKTVVETKKNGAVTTTETAKDGSTVKTVKRPDGTSETSIKQADGLTASIRETRSGARAEVRLPSGTVQEESGVTLPIPALPGKNADVTIHTGSARSVRVEIPAEGDPDTTVAYLTGPDGSQTLVRTAVLDGGRIALTVPNGATVRLRDNRKDFHDVKGHWAEEAIGFAAARELFSGRTPTTFAPDAPMSRAMLMTVLARLDGVNASGASAYEAGAAWAVAQGVSDGRNPEALVTREQFAAMLHRCAGSPAAANRKLQFSDAETISGYAREAVRWAAENGILSGYGDGSFVSGGRATRAQAAAMLSRYVSYLSRQ